MHAKREAVAGMFNTLDHAIGGQRIDHAAIANAGHRLVMRGIHRHARLADDARQQSAFSNGHLMPRLRTRIGLFMRQSARHLIRDVLKQPPAEGHRKQLLPAAYAKHGLVAGQGRAGCGHFEIRPAWLQRDFRVRRAAAPKGRVHIKGAAGHHQPIHLGHIGFRHFGVMRQRHGQAAGGDNGREIIPPKRIPRQLGPAAGLFGIEGHTNQGKGSHGAALGYFGGKGKRAGTFACCVRTQSHNKGKAFFREGAGFGKGPDTKSK